MSDTNKPELGISLRFIRAYDEKADRFPQTLLSVADRALALAMNDTRQIPFAEKYRDAVTFLKERMAQ